MTDRLVMMIVRLFLCLVVFGEATNGQRLRITGVNGAGYSYDTPKGVVLVNYNGSYGTVCGHQFDDNAAAVFCRQRYRMYGGRVAVAGSLGTGSGPIHLDEVICHGNETNLNDCQYSGFGTHNCTHQDDVAVICGFDLIRLVGGDSGLSGRVEVRYNGTWGTICAHQFDENMATIVCKRLGYSRYGAKISFAGRFGRGTGPILFEVFRCNVGEAYLNRCYHSDFGIHNCSRGEDVGVICVRKHISAMRLVNSRYPYEGRLEVQYEQYNWGTVSDDSFDDNAARVVCAYLGYSEHGAVAAHFGQVSGYGYTVIDNVVCEGNETSLNDCQHRVNPRHTNNHRNDVGVICGQKQINRVRLVNGRNGHEGRVEVLHEGVWGSVCNTGFDNHAARVVCAFIGYSVHGAVAVDATNFGQGTGPIFLDDVMCYGNESTLNDCQHGPFGTHDCKHFNDVGVICGQKQINSLRLVNGMHAYEGRVEVLHEGVWGAICNNGFNDDAARVVCVFLGYSVHDSEATFHAHFGLGTGPILLDNVVCHGNESSLNECHHTPFGMHTCKNREDVGVRCGQKLINHVRLINGSNPQEGRVEVLFDGVWGTVCDDGFNDDAARVVCSYLGYSGDVYAAVARVHAHFGEGTGPIVLDDVVCHGNESSLNDCQYRPFATHDCTHREDVGVDCGQQLQINPVRLVNGSTPNEGRVEVLHHGVWGTVCDDEFNEGAARVVCAYVGYGSHHAVVRPQAFFGQGTGPIFFDNVICQGNERSLNDCQHRGIGVSNCEHNEDVGVICDPPQIRLVNGRNPREGRVEVLIEGVWGTVCDDNFDSNGNAASVVCRQLGYSSQDAVERHFGSGTGPILLDGVRCHGNETSLFDCQHNSIGSHDCSHSEDAGVVCHEGCGYWN